MYLGLEYLNSYVFIVSVMDKYSKVVQISPYTLEGLFHFLDHSDVRVIALNIDFNAGFMSSFQNKSVKHLEKKLYEYFEFRVINEKDKKYYRSIVYTDVDEFFKKVIRKEILPINTAEGIEQRLYNIPKTGIKLNRNFLSKNREVLIKQLNAVILSYTALSYHTNNFDFIDEEESYILPKYRYVPLKSRNQENSSP